MTYIKNQELTYMMNVLVSKEEKRLKVNSDEFQERHNEIMSAINQQQELMNDLRLELQEGA